MPKKVIYTREEIIEKAYEMFKSEGLNQITARTLAKKLKTSQRLFMDILIQWKY